MSVLFDINSTSIDYRHKLISDLTIKQKETKFNKNPKPIYTFKFDDEININQKNNNELLIPFSYAYHHNIKNDKEYPRTDYKFVGKLNDKQELVKKEIFDILNETKSIILSFHVGYGKTIYAIYLLSKLKYKSIIILNRINLIDQWKLSIKKFCPDAKVQIIESKTNIDDEADIYLINIITIQKRNPNIFKNIGIVVSDESHLLCSNVYSKCLLYFQPKYLIALTATPIRDDGLHYILELYFGPYVISKELWYPCNIYYIKTGFKPVVEKTERGVNWNSVLKSQAECEYRNNLIIKIARYFKSRNFLILCKYKSQCNYIYDNLKPFETNTELFIGTSEDFDTSCRVLVSTFSKVGVGFDFPKLDALIIASDVEAQIIQYYGRVFRRDNIIPIIFDFIDSNGSLYKHWRTRQDIYLKAGGLTKDFTIYFPEFFTFWNNNIDIIFK